MKKKIVALMLAFNMVIGPALSQSATLPGFYGKVKIPGVAELPSNGRVVSGNVTIANPTPDNVLNITQSSPNAVINWDKFNIGANATVRFYQGTGTPGMATWAPNSSYAALNRIYDQNPSAIYGKLIADGKVYLINQNGILFGSGSQVNVHSLVASALNLKDADFYNGLLRFRSENYQDPNYAPAAVAANLALPPPDATAAVSNFGNIATDTGGTVFLLGPVVENGGTITAPLGKINLVAVQGAGSGASPTNSEVSIVENSDPGTTDVVFSNTAITGTTYNYATGRLVADSGRIGLYGSTVEQDGLIRAVSAVKRGGEIYLAASNRVVTGASSHTETPVSDSTEKADQSFAFSGGTIAIGGLSTKTDEAATPVKQPLQVIEHEGAILSPGGTVTLNAVTRVLLDTGSSINVAGLWVDEPATAAIIEAQLNSVQMADFFGQKSGPLLGQTIYLNLLKGSSIGDVSSYYTTQDKTALERSTRGGTITIDGSNIPNSAAYTPLGQLIVMDGSLIDVSGGGLRYGAGTVSATKLLSGNNVYDISKAPSWLSYRNIFTMKEYAPAWIAGSDAGTLSLTARQVVLDGALKASVTRGQYQTAVTSHVSLDPTDQNNKAYFASMARGLEEPAGGTLNIGVDLGGTGNVGTSLLTSDSVVNEIVVKPTVTPFTLSDTNPRTDPVTGAPLTELSAAILNNAGLGSIGLFANTSLTIDAGARLNLLPGGSFTARARRIENYGEVYVPGGSAEFMIRDNITSHPFLYDSTTQQLDVANTRYVPLDSTLYFAPGSVVSVAGEKVDNSIVDNGGTGMIRNGHTNGGQLTIQDFTVGGTIAGNNLVVAQGALLDVSGGYMIGQTGKISGADAGTMTLRAMNLSLDGDLRGLALPGKKGGQINLHAGEIEVVTPDALLSDPSNGKLLLADDRFQDTGFTRIGLTAINNITFENGTDLEPSMARLPFPVTGGAALSNTIFTTDYLGPTSVSAAAGVNIYTGPLLDPLTPFEPNHAAKVAVAAGAAVKTVPGGAITMTGPSVDVAGDLQALSGNISLKSSLGDLTISGTVDASGYLKPVTDTVAGQPAGPAPQAAGTVSLEASAGGIVLNTGAKVDVSGTAPTDRIISGPSGVPVRVTVAGDPGSLNFTYGTGLTLDGEIDAQARYTGVRGGTLSITKNLATNAGMTVSDGDLRRYQASGFDALTLQSPVSIAFTGPVDFKAGRSLTLDAPLITGTGQDDVALNAPWVRLVNTSSYLPATIAAGTGNSSTLSLAGDWIDLQGSTSVTGFGNVLLAAQRDMRFTDQLYPVPGQNISAWYGGMATDSNLTLQAARIYPTTASDITITSHGKVTILPSGYSDTTPIYSAGGNLTINADHGIEHRGVLAAPMGSITLNATGSGQNGRVYLADGSVIKTSGDAAVNYGSFDGTFWTVKDIGSTKGPAVSGAPDKSITVNGDQVFAMNGAQLDFGGGGSVYTYLYEPGIEGTTNPISITGVSALTGQTTRGSRYVIMPDNSMQLPGFTDKVSGKVLGAIHLEATTLSNGVSLKEGTYSILPEQFAFVPGALVITDLGSTVGAGGGNQITKEGYRVVGGYQTFLGTTVKSSVLEAYSIRSAADVLTEGHFTKPEPLVAGDAGSMNITGNTTVMASTVKAGAIPGFKAGILTLGGAEINVQENVTALDPSTFFFDTPVPQEVLGRLQIAASTLSGYGLGELDLGDAKTSSLTVKQGSILNVPVIKLAALTANVNGDEPKVMIESGATVNAGDSVTLSAPTGKVDIQAGALVHASKTVTLNANDVNLEGDLTADAHGSMNLQSSSINFVPDSFTSSGNGLYLTEGFWKSFADYDQVTLKSGADLILQRDVTMTVGGALTVDAGRFTGQTNVVFNATKIILQNSGRAPATPATPATGTGDLTLNADEIQAHGNLAFDGFGVVNLTSKNDLTLLGAGSLTTPGALNMTAARVATSYYRDANNTYGAADFTITATGDIDIMKGAGTAGSVSTPGGTLAINGKTITLEKDAVVEVASGQVEMTAAGDITVNGGAGILARGIRLATADPNTFYYAPGGRITLQSNNGKVDLQSGSTLDVSAIYGGDPAIAPVSWDAGTIVLSAPKQGVAMAGIMNGTASNGLGGSLTLDSLSLDGVGGLDGLAGKLRDGGFKDRISVRSRTGDLLLSDVRDNNNLQLAALKGREIQIAADQGSLTINGLIDSDAADAGGRVELYAQKDLTVTGGIQARGASGGDVYLNSESGMLSLNNGVIDVSGGSGGNVTLRARENATAAGVNMALTGEIRGANQVVAEAFTLYDNSYYNSSTKNNVTIANIDTTFINQINAELNTYMDTANGGAKANAYRIGLLAGLIMPAGWDASSFHFRPGVEIRKNGDLAVANTWDFTTWRFNGEPGVVSLRAAGNLNVNANVVDHPTKYNTLFSNTMQPSWGINLVAGADQSGASPFAVNTALAGTTTNTGNLTIKSGSVVYTEDAPIRFASANNANIDAGGAAGYMVTSSQTVTDSTTGNGTGKFLPMSYTLASYGGTIRGDVGNDLVFNSGSGTSTAAIQTATGDIELRVGQDLSLGSGTGFGAIRTTGEYAQGATVETGPGSGTLRSAKITDYWTYRHGGDIRLDVGGAVSGDISSIAWDSPYGGGTSVKPKNMHLAASFEGANSTKGIATMGGGDISVRTGGSFNTQIGAFGTDNLQYSGSGNLTIVAGGDLNGRFRVMDGAASLTSAGNFGGPNAKEILEIADTRLTLSAQGDVHVGAIVNPDESRNHLTTFFGNGVQPTWNLTYSKDTGVSIASLAGDVTLYGVNTFANYSYGPLESILPATFALVAAGDVRLLTDFYQAPAPNGNLRLFAGGSIDGEYPASTSSTVMNSAKIYMTDRDPATFYGYQTGNVPDGTSPDDISAKVLVHTGDASPIEIHAGADIRNLQFHLTKKAEITAGGDIVGLAYSGQNIDPADVSRIQAGGDIHYDYILSGSQSNNVSPLDLGIKQGGPGTLVVQAGNDIDLGNSQGIKTNGNFDSPLLGGKGADLIVVAGAKKIDVAGILTDYDFQPADAVNFFGKVDDQGNCLDGLCKAGNDYSQLKAEGKTAEAQQVLDQARSAIIRQHFDEPATDGTGSISMTKSQITTLSGQDAVYVMARGSVNVGQTAFKSEDNLQASGITTASGGPINIYAGGDVNVNESRVMTFLGGNITVWSDQGNINAGRGSRTTISAAPPQRVSAGNGQFITRFSPPAVGSGIRALTYDPDGIEGPLLPPAPGNIYLFAPKGAIDAGEAGIAGGKVVLGATQVLNTNNISFTAGSVGVPSTSEAGVSLGALAGAGSVAEASKTIADSTVLGAARDSLTPQIDTVDSFLSKFLDVKVINFDLDTEERGKGERE